MYRICQQNIYSQKKTIFTNAFFNKCLKSEYKVICVSQQSIARRYATKEKQDNLLEKIYYGPLTPQIKAVKLFSLMSSIAGLAAQPIIIREASSIGSTSLIIALCSVVGFFTFVTPILLHFITKKYVTEIHYDPETYTYKATTINFFLSPVTWEFKAENVNVPDIPGMFTTMNAKGKPLFIEARHFTDPLYYAKIMGYDKPMDFKLGEDQSSDSNKGI